MVGYCMVRYGKIKGTYWGVPDLRMAFATHPIRPTISPALNRAAPELLQWHHTAQNGGDNGAIRGGGFLSGVGAIVGVVCKGRIRQVRYTRLCPSIGGSSTGWIRPTIPLPDTTLRHLRLTILSTIGGS